jgi:3-oxoacyl-[acyl-carrier protein] reductase/2-[hydroxy(phenyl)methyl]-succinyl-CoA dehydrogenase BbsC subunit
MRTNTKIQIIKGVTRMEVVNDRVSVISGATDEIGTAISMRLAKKGAKVIICDLDENKVNSLVSDIQSISGKGYGVVVDYTDAEQVKTSMSKILSEFGKIDILINNLDNRYSEKIENLTNTEWERSFSVNMSPVFYFSREILPVMCSNKYGRIVNVSSIEYMGWPESSNYSAAKSAIFGFTRSLALESAKDDVTVNCVAKGDIQIADISDDDRDKVIKGIPVKKLGTVEDVARTVGFFASDTSKYITGQIFFVCGGKSAYFSMSI